MWVGDMWWYNFLYFLRKILFLSIFQKKAKHYGFYNKIYGSEKLNPILGFVSFLRFCAALRSHSTTLLLLLLVLCGWMHLNSFYSCVATFNQGKKANNFFSGGRRTTLILKTLNINIHNGVMKLSFHGVTFHRPHLPATAIPLYFINISRRKLLHHGLNAVPKEWRVGNSKNKKKSLLKRCQKVLCNKQKGRISFIFHKRNTDYIQYNVGEKQRKFINSGKRFKGNAKLSNILFIRVKVFHLQLLAVSKKMSQDIFTWHIKLHKGMWIGSLNSLFKSFLAPFSGVVKQHSDILQNSRTGSE